MPTTTTTPLHQPALAQELRNFGTALRELMNAARQLWLAMWTTFLHRNNHPQLTLTAVEEANQLRAVAAGYYANDPRFAQELYAAANRHELTSSSC